MRRRLHSGLWVVLILISGLSTGCDYPDRPPNLPTDSVSNSRSIGTLTPKATAIVTEILIPIPTLTPGPSLTPTQTTTHIPTSTDTPTPSNTPIPEPVIFGVIGDYGSRNDIERDVANLILSWQPDFIITVGDNNYPDGAYDTIDAAIGKYFHDYIYPYVGSYGDGAAVNRFFPTLGNHDLRTDDGKPYFDYFTLPGNERYYDFIWGPAHFFALNNIDSEPDGVGASSKQAAWLQSKLEASTSTWNIVYMHYPPFSSGMHGSTNWARWPYKEWGADVVLAGHDHTYERLEEDGLTYFVDGIGGNGIYDFVNIVEGSQVRYNGDYGGIRVEMTDTRILFQFFNRSMELVDWYEMGK
jgi:tartrate-resistant acid phosphatase type 5